MFEVGFTELLLISALALLVLGPQKLPKLAQQIGRWVGRARAMARQFRDQLEEEAHTLETKMSVDPGIDTSLEPRKPATPSTATPAPAPPAATTEAATAAAPAEPAVPAMYAEHVEEQFYPPDHHMHPANRHHGETGAGAGAQAELDLTTTPDTPRGT
jgi:sec-independent protein translocase protein TatB